MQLDITRKDAEDILRCANAAFSEGQGSLDPTVTGQIFAEWPDLKPVSEYVIKYRSPYQALDSEDRGIRLTATDYESALRKFRQLYPNAEIVD